MAEANGPTSLDLAKPRLDADVTQRCETGYFSKMRTKQIFAKWRPFIAASIGLGLLLAGCGGSGTTADSTSAVGRRAIDLVDTSRVEKFGGTAGDPRKLEIYVWYPATPDKGTTKGPFLPDAQAEIVAASLTGITKETIKSLPTSSYLDSSAAPGSYPVLIMSHGDGNPILEYSSTAEYLAGRGYVVVGISHTYNALCETAPLFLWSLFSPACSTM